MQQSVQLELTLRPIRLAHLVNPRSNSEILQAISINSMLWGGRSNPLIPTYKRLPSNLRDSSLPSSEVLINGYLDTFDPDFVVTYESTAYITEGLKHVDIVPASEILGRCDANHGPQYGIGLFEVLEAAWEKELRFLAREPISLIQPTVTRNFRLFLASALGYLPPKFLEILRTSFSKHLGIEERKYSIVNYHDIWPMRTTFKMLSLFDVNKSWRPLSLTDSYLFFMDATSNRDIIDFWNLRAAGYPAVPICMQSVSSSDMKSAVADFVNEYYYPLPSNKKLIHRSTVLKSHSVSTNNFDSFFDEYAPIWKAEGGEPKVLRQTSSPRIWDRWTSDENRFWVSGLVSKRTSQDVQSLNNRLSFNLLQPEFSISTGGNVSPRFANEVNFTVYSDKELFAEVFPEGNFESGAIFGYGGSLQDYRFSKTGIVHFGSIHDHRTLYLPLAESIFLKWMESQQWSAEISSGGRIAKQMFKQLGGKYGINLLAANGLINLLAKFSNERTANENEFIGELSKICSSTGDQLQTLLQGITAAQMFRLGIELQCPVCAQRSWYSIADADYNLQCTKCLETFSIPSHSPQDIKWSYRTFGSFSLPRQAYGSYSVLLTLRFFSLLFHGLITPIFSFNGKKGSTYIEADLGILFQKHRNLWSISRKQVIFAECKTFNSFTTKDIKRMKQLGREFPDSFLVFSTLNEKLGVNEKILLSELTKQNRRRQQAGKQYNPVIVLTGIELLGYSRPPECWAKLGSSKQLLSNRQAARSDLIYLADTTQQIHLDLPGNESLPPETW